MSPSEHPAVERVRVSLRHAGLSDRVIILTQTARSAEDAAAALSCDLGAIVKSLVFVIGGQPVMALVSGDRRCREKALKKLFDLPGKVKRANADQVRDATGFAIGGVAPVGHPQPLRIAIDDGLFRYPTVHAAAGHPFCVFPLTPEELLFLTGGTRASDIAE